MYVYIVCTYCTCTVYIQCMYMYIHVHPYACTYITLLWWQFLLWNLHKCLQSRWTQELLTRLISSSSSSTVLTITSVDFVSLFSGLCDLLGANSISHMIVTWDWNTVYHKRNAHVEFQWSPACGTSMAAPWCWNAGVPITVGRSSGVDSCRGRVGGGVSTDWNT